MVNSAKRAKRKRLAQEAQRREASRPTHQMDSGDLSDLGTDREEEDDHEIMFTYRIQKEENLYRRRREPRRPWTVRSSIW